MAAYRRVYDSHHMPRSGISSGTLRSVMEYGLPLPFLHLPAVSRSGGRDSVGGANSECDR